MAKLLPYAWTAGSRASLNARRYLPKLAAAYFAEARTLLNDVSRPAHLHRLRLLSKRLRYTLELFRPCYDAGLEERLGSLKRLQDILGEINDAVASAYLIEEMPGSLQMRQYLEQRAARKAARFLTEWRTHFDAPGRELWWTSYLGS
jgi:CHAD domain-containing protein